MSAAGSSVPPIPLYDGDAEDAVAARLAARGTWAARRLDLLGEAPDASSDERQAADDTEGIAGVLDRLCRS